MADPFREQRLHPDEVRRVLRRAIDLAEKDPDRASSERSVTREELERAAVDLGLSAAAVREAAAAEEPERAGEADGDDAAHDSVFLGGPKRIKLKVEVDGEPDESDLEDIVDDIQEIVGEPGSVDRVGKTLQWTVANPSGYRRNARQLSVRIRTRRGRTRVVVDERLAPAYLGLFVGLGIGGGIGPLGGYIAAIAKLGVVGFVVPLVWIPLMFLLARTIYGAIARGRQRELRRLRRAIERRAAAWSEGKSTGQSAGARIAAPEGRDEAGERVEEDAAEQEAEEAEAAIGSRARA